MFKDGISEDEMKKVRSDIEKSYQAIVTNVYTIIPGFSFVVPDGFAATSVSKLESLPVIQSVEKDQIVSISDYLPKKE
jgi:hypothetical protein